MNHLLTVLHAVAMVSAAIYALSVAVLAVYGLHSLWLLRLFLKHRRAAQEQAAREDATPLPPDAELPRILVQLPVFNERDVVTRLVDAIGRLEWPRDRLTIQLLDDSTDDSVVMGEQAVAALRARGHDAVSIHRVDRTGFKAGALENGMKACDAPFIAIFDADFIPKPDFLKIAIKPLLADDGLALVQGRWDHLNRDDNLLTKAQALGIDGHFAIEQGARAWSGLAMNFNGTCGLWRRQAIIDGGGWEHDTLTEDMDLSYRAQLKGWRCTYRLGLDVPGEVPATLSAWRSQQFRWAKGSIQTACKLLPRVWRSPWSFHAKLAATLHMTHYCVHPLILLSLIAAPMALLTVKALPVWILMLGAFGFLIGAGSPIALYAASQWVLRGTAGLKRLRILPALAAIGTGIAVSNAIAVYEAMIGRHSEFVRTPKQGFGKGSYKASMASGIPELLCASWAAVGVAVGMHGPHPWIAPLLMLYISGFLWVAWFSLKERAVAMKHQLGARSPLPSLVPAGLAGVATVGLLAAIPGGWRDQPVLFALVGCALGALWLTAVQAVRRRPGGAWTLAWIVAVTIALRVAAFGLPAGESAHRALVEGRQVAAGQNPYLIAPAHPDAFALVPDRIDEASYVAAADPGLTAANPPLMQLAQVLAGEIAPTPLAIKVMAGCAELLALALALALVVRLGLPPAMIVAAAWCPIGPLLASGGGTPDALAAAAVALAALLAVLGQRTGGLLAATAAALLRPVGVVALVPQLMGRSWRWALLPLALVVAAFLPFASAGGGLLRGLVERLTALQGHGPLEPVARWLVEPWLPAALVPQATVLLLLAGFLAGCTWWALRAQRDPQHPRHVATLTALLLVCLPTFAPGQLVVLAVLLPFTASWGLLAWVAMAPLWWLAPADGPAPAWLALVAHAPLVVWAWELAGRPLWLGRSLTLAGPDAR